MANLRNDHGFISKEYISIGVRPFVEAQKSHESLYSKWTISYHCGESRVESRDS